MAAAAAAIARRNAQDGEGGKRQRGLKRRSSYVSFLATHEPDTLDTLKAELGTVERKPTTFEVAQSKALPGLECMGHEKCVRCCTDLRDNKWFQVSVIGVIFLAGILVGIQTYPIEPGSQTAVTLGVLDTISKFSLTKNGVCRLFEGVALAVAARPCLPWVSLVFRYFPLFPLCYYILNLLNLFWEYYFCPRVNSQIILSICPGLLDPCKHAQKHHAKQSSSSSSSKSSSSSSPKASPLGFFSPTTGTSSIF